jgi:hypothetical protein
MQDDVFAQTTAAFRDLRVVQRQHALARTSETRRRRAERQAVRLANVVQPPPRQNAVALRCDRG